MLDFLKSFADFLVNVVEFIVSFFRNVIEVCLLVFKSVSYANTVISYIPIQYRLVFSAILAFLAIKAIIHFGG